MMCKCRVSQCRDLCEGCPERGIAAATKSLTYSVDAFRVAP